MLSTAGSGLGSPGQGRLQCLGRARGHGGESASGARNPSQCGRRACSRGCSGSARGSAASGTAWGCSVCSAHGPPGLVVTLLTHAAGPTCSCLFLLQYKPVCKEIQTQPYRALEVLLGLDYSTPADIWSTGCLVGTRAAGVRVPVPAARHACGAGLRPRLREPLSVNSRVSRCIWEQGSLLPASTCVRARDRGPAARPPRAGLGWAGHARAGAAGQRLGAARRGDAWAGRRVTRLPRRPSRW